MSHTHTGPQHSSWDTVVPSCQCWVRKALAVNLLSGWDQEISENSSLRNLVTSVPNFLKACHFGETEATHPKES